MRQHPSYVRVFGTFARNSLMRDLSFRWNFLIDAASSLTWMLMNLGFYLLIFSYTDSIGASTGWGKHQFFVFLSTTLFINSLVQAFFMPNAEEFSELIRTGQLDFALLKPIDTQFLISLAKIEFSSLSNFCFAAVLLCYSLWQLHAAGELQLSWVQVLIYPLYVLCGVGILYSLMIGLAATSIWLGRNTSLYDFWFYITNFSRYPMEIYDGRFGSPLRFFFTWIVPVLIVVNVPARLLAMPFQSQEWPLVLFAIAATIGSLWISRQIFQRALFSYRSASS